VYPTAFYLNKYIPRLKGAINRNEIHGKGTCQKAFRIMKFHLDYQIQKFQVNDKKDDS